MVNSPLRAFSLHLLEPWAFGQILAFPQGKRALDIGCGNGQGLAMLAARAKPAKLLGIDLDPAQVARAQARMVALGIPATVRQGRAEELLLADGCVDIITSLGCIHHVPNWRGAVAESARVLAPHGVMYLLEFYRPLLLAIHWLAPHPPARFGHTELLEEITKHKLQVLGQWQCLGLFGVVVAQKSAT